MKLACLVLAAGAGSRFGGHKQLAPLEGKPLLQHSLEQLQPLFAEHLYCVVGAYADQVRPIAEPRAQVIMHPEWAEGLGSSIAKGVDTITHRGYHGVLITLADQVALRAHDYRQLRQRFDGRRIVASAYAGKLAVPALFPARCFDALQQLQGDRGAQALLRANADQVQSVALPEAATDIDTLAELEAFSTRRPAG